MTTHDVATTGRTGRGRAAAVLAAFLGIAYAAAALGTITTIQNVDGWYADAAKVPWNPPDAVFGPVWTVLYALMSIAAWRVWLERDRRPTAVRRALAAYVVQLVLNAVWTPVFFGLYPAIGAAALWLAVAIIVLLDGAVVVTLVLAGRVSRLAAALLAPYLAWCLFATTLAIGTAVLNS